MYVLLCICTNVYLWTIPIARDGKVCKAQYLVGRAMQVTNLDSYSNRKKIVFVSLSKFFIKHF